MTLSFKLSIEMTSDWHIGSGQGRHGSIDRLIDRDADDLPFIPASTIRGIWRDAAQRLARGLDDGGENGPWSKFAEQLFGNEPTIQNPAGLSGPAPVEVPAASLIALWDGRLSGSLRGHFIGSTAERKTLRQTLTFIKPGVSIDRRSGAAKQDFLRFEEVSRADLTLQAEGEAAGAPADAEAVVAAFLAGAAALVERLGGKRRRGMGLCKIAVTFTDAGKDLPQNVGAAAEILAAAAAPPHIGVEKIAEEKRSFAARGPDREGLRQETSWVKVGLRITLCSPLIASDEVRGNVVTCQDHIPSGLLLAPVASWLEGALTDVWPLIAAGDVRVLAATPEIEGERSLPVPFCWEQPKGAKGDDRNYYSIFDPDGAAEKETQRVAVRSGFVSAQGTGETSVKHLSGVRKILRTHNTIKDDIQRPHEDVGGVYTYEALAAGQVFRSEVWIRKAGFDKAKLEKFWQARLGRARQAGYGLAKIETLDTSGASPERIGGDKLLRIWLASDAIPASPMGAGGLDALAAAVADSLGKKVEDLFATETKGGRNVLSARGNLRWRRLEGWQSRWGLPRPTLTALQAGSTAEFKLKIDLAIDDILLLEREGIGERRGEGLGSVIANHAYLASSPAAKLIDAKIEEETPAGTHETKFINDIREIAWRHCIALRAEAAAVNREYRKTHIAWKSGAQPYPSMSQLGALRSVMGELPNDAACKAVAAWASGLDPKKWSTDAIAALVALFQNARTVWPLLGLEGEDTDQRFAGAPKPGKSPPVHLARFALRALLLHAMRFHKRDSEQADNNSGEEAAA